MSSSSSSPSSGDGDNNNDKKQQPSSRVDLIRKLLKGIETGDPDSVTVVNESKYIQHNPQTAEGEVGLAELFARLSKTNPRVNIVRAFEDDPYVFGQTEYDFSTRRIGFEVFRFEGNQAVEHWDNIQPRKGPNTSGRSMVDGPTEAVDLDRTEDNRRTVRSFVQKVYVERQLDRIEEYTNSEGILLQHLPDWEDGAEFIRCALSEKQVRDEKELPKIQYETIHRVLACGSFVLVVTEGYLDRVHTSFYDLYRLDDGKIVEQWGTREAVPPRSLWKNNNGKF